MTGVTLGRRLALYRGRGCHRDTQYRFVPDAARAGQFQAVQSSTARDCWRRKSFKRVFRV